MGGRALSNYSATRLNKAEYKIRVHEFMSRVSTLFNIRPVLIQAYFSKESFGDADILLCSEDLPIDWINKLKTYFYLSPEQFIKNGNVVSIGVDNFQFDLIITPRQELKTAEMYFSFNDCWNIIGRIGHKIGVKIGHRGLFIVVRNSTGTHILQEVKLTGDLYVALDILGLDVVRYNQGFNTLIDIFEYVSTSKYFDPVIYDLSNRNATARKRDKNRVTYNEFLKWIEVTKPTPMYNFTNKTELGGYSIRLPYYYTEIVPRFPWIEDHVNQLIQADKLNTQFKQVFNGEILQQYTGLSGSDLGELIKKLKLHITDDTKRDLIHGTLTIAQLLKTI